jgi:hypothetical protein
MGSQRVWLHQNGLSVSVVLLGVSVVASFGCDSVASREVSASITVAVRYMSGILNNGKKKKGRD